MLTHMAWLALGMVRRLSLNVRRRVFVSIRRKKEREFVRREGSLANDAAGEIM